MTVAGLLADLAGTAAAEAVHVQRSAGQSARPLVHVLLAYGFAWTAILGWAWRIARLRRARRSLPANLRAEPGSRRERRL